MNTRLIRTGTRIQEIAGRPVVSVLDDIGRFVAGDSLYHGRTYDLYRGPLVEPPAHATDRPVSENPMVRPSGDATFRGVRPDHEVADDVFADRDEILMRALDLAREDGV